MKMGKIEMSPRDMQVRKMNVQKLIDSGKFTKEEIERG